MLFYIVLCVNHWNQCIVLHSTRFLIPIDSNDCSSFEFREWTNNQWLPPISSKEMMRLTIKLNSCFIDADEPCRRLQSIQTRIISLFVVLSVTCLPFTYKLLWFNLISTNIYVGWDLEIDFVFLQLDCFLLRFDNYEC